MAQEEKQQPTVDIKLFKNGPYLVDGTVSITTTDGVTKEYTNPHLCRCGASENKPFCDGTHNKIGFEG